MFVKNEDINMLCKLSAEPTDVTLCEDPTFSTVLFFLKTYSIWFAFSLAPCVNLHCCISARWRGGDRELFMVSRVVNS